ncbi:Exodeoxyribonuclease [Tritrichomonas foetus]|uniref:Exodeoxyribonuclease n=1 Tax=Tritrichomonas foetus TaxID=1144522 RepID=A0A1J4KQ22_9EUKA|nr:Exodeoxyribonuclease [Tritrichomonas foetus]|eukprot:OHT13391.1 Exodeoxyribonuclease [Tritrichomonas foetus]
MTEETTSIVDVTSDIFTIITWNIASLRAAWKKGFKDFVKLHNPDILCIQETKMYNGCKPPISDFVIEGYHGYFSHAAKKGYSGTAIYTKIKPKSINKTPGITDTNGRCITAEFNNFGLLNSYVPNAGEGTLKNLDYKLINFLPEYKKSYTETDDKLSRPLFLLGDLNICHKEIDIWDAKNKENIAGNTPGEREWLNTLFTDNNYYDIFRDLYPDKRQYSYFEYRRRARETGNGMRIDYFIAKREKIPKGMIVDCYIGSANDISDHDPVFLTLNKSLAISSDDIVETDYANESLQ